MADRVIAAYEAAYDLLQEPSTFAATGALPHPTPVLLRLAGMDEPLAWPLCAVQAAQVAALYPNKVITAANIHVEGRCIYDPNHMLDEISGACLPHLVPSSDACMQLSHMVVDDVGDADSFRLLPSDDDDINTSTFGVLIVLLPSAHIGGAITFTYGTHSKTFDDDTSLLETSFAAAFLTTTITSAPITSGRRVALIYRVYYGDEERPLRMAPTVQDAAIAAFRALGQSTTHEVQRLGLDLKVSHYPLSFEELAIWETGFVNVLLAAGNFDVGLATLLGDTRKVDVFEPHPACNVPDAVARGLIGHTLQGFLHMPLAEFETFAYPSCVLAFWPKRHRVCIVDIEGIASFLQLRLARGDDNDHGYLGISDTRELLLGVMPFFGADGPSLVDVMTRVPYEDHRYTMLHEVLRQHNWNLFETMQQLMTLLNDVTLSTALLDGIAVTNVLPVAKVAPVIHGLLTKHGWEPLQASMLQLVQRWIDMDPDATLQLLTSLAGLDTDAPVCPPLHQRYEAELFKRCYDVVLSTPDLFTKSDYYEGTRGCKFVKGLFLLEHHVTRMAPQLQGAHYASQCLPANLVPAIDAFLFAFRPSVERLLASSTVMHPLKDLGVGLASAVRCQPSLPLPPTVIDIILGGLTAPMERQVEIHLASCHADVAAAVLVLASRTARLDATLFAMLWGIYDLQVLPIVASISSELHDDAILSELVVSYIARSVTVVVDDVKWPKPFNKDNTSYWKDGEPHDDIAYREAIYKFGADVFVSAVQLLERFAPYAVVAYATRWLELLPATFDVLHDRLLPVVPRLDRHSGAYSLLLTAMIDRFAAEPALPTVLDFAMAPPPDLHPGHCHQCREAYAFLERPDTAMLMLFTNRLFTNRREVCTSLSHVFDANATRLCISATGFDSDVFRLEKVQQPGQVSEAAWLAHHVKMRMHARIAACIATLTRQAGDEQQAEASLASNEPSTKRVRQS